MSLFMCNGICAQCTESDCPFRYDDDFQETLANQQQKRMAERMIFNPASIIELMQQDGHSLFNAINSWRYSDADISAREIRRYLIIFLPESFVKTMPSELDALFQNIMRKIVHRIHSVVQEKCKQYECSHCEIGECCPITQKNTTRH